MIAQRILLVQSSPRSNEDSVTRDVANTLISRLVTLGCDDTLTVTRECSSLPYVDADFIDKAMNPLKYALPAAGGEESKEAEVGDQVWRCSWECCEELLTTDIIIIAAPCYNFSIPASLKAWVDLCCVIKRTYAFGEKGPAGLLEGKAAYLVVATGGMDVGSAYDFGTRYLRHILSLWGITNITVVDVSHGVKKAAFSLIAGIAALPRRAELKTKIATEEPSADAGAEEEEEEEEGEEEREERGEGEGEGGGAGGEGEGEGGEGGGGGGGGGEGEEGEGGGGGGGGGEGEGGGGGGGEGGEGGEED